MINISSDKSISKQIIYNNKPQSSTYNYEQNLHTYNKFRSIRDTTTDSIVNVLFSYNYRAQPDANRRNTINRNLFLLFVDNEVEFLLFDYSI